MQCIHQSIWTRAYAPWYLHLTIAFVTFLNVTYICLWTTVVASLSSIEAPGNQIYLLISRTSLSTRFEDEIAANLDSQLGSTQLKSNWSFNFSLAHLQHLFEIHSFPNDPLAALMNHHYAQWVLLIKKFSHLDQQCALPGGVRCSGDAHNRENAHKRCSPFRRCSPFKQFDCESYAIKVLTQ